MEIKVITKGRDVPPEPLRGRSGIRVDSLTGLPVLHAGTSAPILSSKEVAEIQAMLD